MSDAAFKTAAYPAYTITELRTRCAEIDDMNFPTEEVCRTRNLMLAEIERRERVAAGDVFSMTAAERLRFYRSRPGCEAFNKETAT